MLSSRNARSALGVAAFFALIGIVLGITAAALDPPGSDLALYGTFMLLFGGATIGLGLAARRHGLPPRMATLQFRLVLASFLTAVVALANVGFIAALMFLSNHDLALLAGLLAFSLGVSAFASFSFAEPAVRGLHDLVAAARNLSAGRLDTRVTVRSPNEVGVLADAFNSMAEQLEAAFQRERELERSRRDLVRAISHDLRTPLSSIRVMVESINDGVVVDPDTIKRYLRTAQSEAEHLSQLINDLFELSQMDAGVLQLHKEELSLRQLIDGALGGMAPQAEARRLNLHSAMDEPLAPVFADPRRIQRVLYNLVQNAIRHTPADGSIVVRVRDAGSVVEVQVTDTGEGIPEQVLPRLFERGYRPDNSRSRESGGAGLGLAIAKGIVEAHGGRIWVESTAGHGSTFCFTIPKAAVATGEG